MRSRTKGDLPPRHLTNMHVRTASGSLRTKKQIIALVAAARELQEVMPDNIFYNSNIQRIVLGFVGSDQIDGGNDSMGEVKL